METRSDLTEIEIEQFSRQLLVPNWSKKKQVHLMSLSVLIEYKYIYSAFYLAAAGIKKIYLLDKEQGSNKSLIKLLKRIHPEIALEVINSSINQQLDWAILSKETNGLTNIKSTIKISTSEQKTAIELENQRLFIEMNNPLDVLVSTAACSIIFKNIL